MFNARHWSIKKKTAILDAIAAQAAVPMKYEKKSAYRGVVDNTAVLALLCDLGILSDTFNFDPENLVRDGLGAFRSQV
ncbi:hypothetical protein F444_12191 [Phytophthora nicotianae P1976]|uniref:Uncharacterized protein n=1 Tax=Phytophthora nicotianae P1976 TaxID=1317066 RepID=A0A080ZXX6_PHYNI|nr:hypothetical protein F444_12191 [Phytophthora nicotianae P1976]